MRTSVLAAISAALLLALVLGYASTAARIAELEERVKILDDNFVHLSIPLEDSKRDISGIYRELDRIRENAGSGNAAPAAPSATVSRPQPDNGSAHRQRVTALARDEDESLTTDDFVPYDYLNNRLSNPQGTFNDAEPDEY